jgi:hypothetical protein
MQGGDRGAGLSLDSDAFPAALGGGGLGGTSGAARYAAAAGGSATGFIRSEDFPALPGKPTGTI